MKKVLSVLLLVALGVVPGLVFGQQIPNPPGGVVLPTSQTTNLNNISNIQSLVCSIFNWMFYILIIVAIFMVLFAAFKYLTAAGDPEKVKTASKMLIYAAVAIAVAIFAQAIPVIVYNFFASGGNSGSFTFSVCGS